MACRKYFDTDICRNLRRQKLSTIYHFIRSLPLLYIEGRLGQELDEIKSTESMMEQEQLKLRQEQLMLNVKLQGFKKRKQKLNERKVAAMTRLKS